MTQGTGEGLLDLDLTSSGKTAAYSRFAVGTLSSEADQPMTTHQFRSEWEQQPHLENIDLHAIGTIASVRSRSQPNAVGVMAADDSAPEIATHGRRRSIIGAVAGAVLLLVIGSVTIWSGHTTAKNLPSTGGARTIYVAQLPNLTTLQSAPVSSNTNATTNAAQPVAAGAPAPNSSVQAAAPVAHPAPTHTSVPTPVPTHQAGPIATPTPQPPKASPTPPPAPVSGSYSGSTSQKQTVSFVISGSTVTNIVFGWSATCADGQLHTNTIAPGNATLTGNTFTVNAQFPSSPTALSVTFHGVVSGKTVSGTFSRSGGSSFNTTCSASGSWTATFQ